MVDLPIIVAVHPAKGGRLLAVLSYNSKILQRFFPADTKGVRVGNKVIGHRIVHTNVSMGYRRLPID